ncbi:MAG TPA: hypothetical protein VFA64_10585 [Hyphomicrobiaceae bacterium]|nr:hypothetical protein [Hyphomicrobiaceae bacterium]
MSQPLERRVIEAARALIATPLTWTQGEFARDASGEPVSWRSPRAASFCVWGALNRAAYELTGDRRQAITLADHAARALRNGTRSLSGTNDSGTHADVMAIFDAYLVRELA